jgi:hypothetical protein
MKDSMHTTKATPAGFTRRESTSTQGDAAADPPATPGQTSLVNNVAASTEAPASKGPRTTRLLDAMFHWALSRS